MLVLTRRVGEEIVLPGMRVRVTLLAVSGHRARLGVVAPLEVAVLRGELDPHADVGPAEPPADCYDPVCGDEP